MNNSKGDAMNLLYFDLETTDLIDEDVPFDEMSIACLALQLVSYPSGDKLSYVYTDKDSIYNFTQYFDLAHAIIGFNVRHFDYEVLRGVCTDEMIGKWSAKTIDLMPLITQKLGRRTSLNTLCKYTIGDQKTMHGKEAVRLWAMEQRQEVISYCEQDVSLLRRLFEFACLHGYVNTYEWDRQSIVKIDASEWHPIVENYLPKAFSIGSPLLSDLPIPKHTDSSESNAVSSRVPLVDEVINTMTADSDPIADLQADDGYYDLPNQVNSSLSALDKKELDDFFEWWQSRCETSYESLTAHRCKLASVLKYQDFEILSHMLNEYKETASERH